MGRRLTPQTKAKLKIRNLESFLYGDDLIARIKADLVTAERTCDTCREALKIIQEGLNEDVKYHD